MQKVILVAAALLLAAPALAQDHSGHGEQPGGTAAAIDLPAICLANAPDASPGPMHAMDEMASPAHRDLMAGMDEMNAQMMAGGTASDIDVAFVCSMIPHHRGALSMARAELAHGDDAFARELATGIIVAQEREIAEMLDWLTRQ